MKFGILSVIVLGFILPALAQPPREKRTHRERTHKNNNKNSLGAKQSPDKDTNVVPKWNSPHSIYKTFSDALGPQTAEDLPPNTQFTTSQTYKDMLTYIEARHDVKELQASFYKKGYVTFKADIPEETLKAAANFTETIFNRCVIAETKPESCGIGFQNHQERFTDIPAVRDVAQSYHVRSMLAVLHGYEPYPFQTLNYPGESGSRTHSDYVHFAPHPLPLMSAAWIALMDINPDHGPVFYHEGSHHFPYWNMQDMGLDSRDKSKLNYPKYQKIMTEAAKSQYGDPTKFIVPRGHCLIWASNLVHGGDSANVPGGMRLSQVSHYFYRGANYNWAPVASDVNNGQIIYYSEENVNMQWDESLPLEERQSISKFVTGTCDVKVSPHRAFPQNRTVSPCDMLSRPPQVSSKIISDEL